jgi:SOS regulatory protein LexA
MTNDRSHLAQLQDYYAQQGVLPSYAAIGSMIGLKSKSSVAALVARLKLEGFLEATPEKRLKPGQRFFERAIFESVRAGMPHPVMSHQYETLTIDQYLVEHPSLTVLVSVKGDSMIDAGIQEGDIAVVEKRPTANIGDIVIAIVDNEFTLKYLEREKGEFILRPANPAYPVIRPKGQLEIFGVLMGLIRKYGH